MGSARDVVEQARTRTAGPAPSAEVLRAGVRQAQADGSITVLEDWDRPTTRAERPKTAPVVDRSPTRVFD